MGDLNPVDTVSRRFPPRLETAARARRFVRDFVAGTAPELASTAELLTGELVVNAVLHARTEVEVSVRYAAGRVHACVGDREPRRGLVRLSGQPYTETGRGLLLVERLASRHGVEAGAEGKTVWFELGPAGAPPTEPSGWGATELPDGPRRMVTLIDLPWALSTAAQQHRNALLRELVLASAGGFPTGVRASDLTAAHDTNNQLNAAVAAAAEAGPSDSDVRTLTLSVPADETPVLLALRRVLDVAEEIARDEQFLTRPALPQTLAIEHWMFDEIIGQLAGAGPTAWTAPRELIAGPGMMPWDAAQVRNSPVPTVAVDDRNRIITVNEPAADMLGWGVDELAGQRLTLIVPEHLRERHLAAFASLLLTGRPRILGRAVPLPALHRDGRQIPIRLLIQSQDLDDGRTVFVAQLIPRTAAPEPATAEPPETARQHPATVPEGPSRPYSPPLPEPEQRTGTDSAGMSPLERLTLLAESAHTLSGELDLAQALRGVGRLLTRALADWCTLDLLVAHDRVERAVVVHRARQLTPAPYEGELPPMSQDAQGPLARALRGAGPLLFTGRPAAGPAPGGLDARYAELFGQLGAGSTVVAPLLARRQVLGALTLGRTGRARPFTRQDLSLVQDLTQGLALKVQNSRLFDRTRNIAERLQRSLLPNLPDIENLQITARYAPSSVTAEVGGDWYDGFLLPNGDTALVIGDVAGHDIEATAAMSQLRNMVRGIAVVCQEDPQEVLRHLDVASQSLTQDATATCIYAVVKGAAAGPWELVHSSAGHLPPLLIMPDGRTRFLRDAAGVLLGTGLDLRRPVSRDVLPAHATVLLYTDGLIERRDEPLDQSLGRLGDLTATLAREPLDVICDELLIRLGADNTDDIAVVALRPEPPP